jgi:hypothetical protein
VFALIDWADVFPLISIGAILLLPLIPAVILYKFFEQKTIVRGPFKGLRIDLAGAFAGYFLLFITCLGALFGPLQQTKNYKKEVDKNSELEKRVTQLEAENAALTDKAGTETAWTVQGHIKLEGSDTQLIEGVTIATLPPPQILHDGSFEVRVVKDKSSGKLPRLPALEISKAKYLPEVVHLEESGKRIGQTYNKNIDEDARMITIDDLIILKKDDQGYVVPQP